MPQTFRVPDRRHGAGQRADQLGAFLLCRSAADDGSRLLCGQLAHHIVQRGRKFLCICKPLLRLDRQRTQYNLGEQVR